MRRLLVIFVFLFFAVSCSDGGKPRNDNAKDDDSVIMDSDSTVTDSDDVSDIDNIENDVDIVKHDNDMVDTDKDIADIDADIDIFEPDADLDEPDADADTEPSEYLFEGIVQKGPFIKDSSIKVTELDNNFEMIPATTFTTKTVDDLGNFNIKRKFKSRYIEIEATGFYYDEVTGTVSTAQITNYVFVDLYANKSKVNINILTTLARKRIQHLMKNGKNYSEATTQSETELLEIFGIYGELSSNFQDMNILQPGSSNAMLLAISARLQGNNTPGELSNLIAGIIYDIEEDGKLNQLSLKNKLSDGGKYIGSKLASIRTNLETHFGEITTVNIADFEGYCDNDGDGVINKWDFDLDFALQTKSELNTNYISNGKKIILPDVFLSEAIAKTDNGSIIINGEDLGKEVTVVNGDTLAIKLTSASKYATQTIANVSVEIMPASGVIANWTVTGKYIVTTLPIWEKISFGAEHACGTLFDKSLYCWGSNNSGQLGNGTAGDLLIPTKVGNDEWGGITSGYEHTCGTQLNKDAFCWGRNDSGSLGDGTNDGKSTPTTITFGKWHILSVSGYHSCGIQEISQNLYCWGENYFGQLGDGTNENKNVPTKVSDEAWSQMTIGANSHTCAIKTDKKLYCWGSNEHGQLGDGTHSGKNTPTKIGINSWNHITAGEAHSCGIQETNKNLYCWGGNQVGQLGDGTNDMKNVPTKIGDDTWVKIAAGGSRTCGIKALDKNLYCWGHNWEGMLGDGTKDNRNVPTRIGNDTWIDVVLGIYNTCAIKEIDSKLYCWGPGYNGDGTKGMKTEPTLVIEPDI